MTPHSKPIQRIPPRGRRFQPGQSGNPAGRPRAPEGFVDYCRQVMKEKGDVALVALAEEADDERVRFSAWKLLAAYAYGPPPQEIQVSGAVGHTFLAIGGDQEAYVGALEHLRTWPQPSTIPH